MRYRLQGILFGVLAVAAVLFAACDQREIVCPGTDPFPLEIAFSWDNAPKAHPDGMTLYFYPADNNGGCRRFDISGCDGGRFELPLGRYNMIAVNNDLPGVRIEGYHGFHSISAVAQSAGSEPGQHLPPVRPTGMLYGGVMTDIEVTMCGVRYRTPEGMLKECPKGLIRCAPDSLAKEYHVIFLNVQGADRISSAKGVLSGMATELLLCDDIAGSEACCVSFPLETETVNDDKGVLPGVTSGFGVPAYGINHHGFSLTVMIKLLNGKVYSKTYDVSAQVENFLHKNSIIIIINGVDIPSGGQPEDEDDGFEVDVSGWNTVEIDL